MNQSNGQQLVINLPNLEYLLFLFFIFYLGNFIYKKYLEYIQKEKANKILYFFNSFFTSAYAVFLLNYLNDNQNKEMLEKISLKIRNFENGLDTIKKTIDKKISSLEKNSFGEIIN